MLAITTIHNQAILQIKLSNYIYFYYLPDQVKVDKNRYISKIWTLREPIFI